MPPSFAEAAAAHGARLTDEQLDRFDRYWRLLHEWSARMNLVSDASRDVVERRHFLESIALGAALREREVMRPDARVVDLGAGAGFPGVPMKIVWPSIALTLVEATAKKAAFLRALIDALAIEADVRSGRAEELGHDAELRGRFDLVVARAVAPLPALLEMTLPFLRAGGRLAAPKGSRAPAEVAAAAGALRTLGGRAFVVPFNVPGPPQHLVVVQKVAETPAVYPRRPGLARRAPLR